jgi:DNA repair exonuclease SbcCD ATPase subunit
VQALLPILPMLSEEQIKKIISANESLQVQLADANAMLAAREQEIDYLHAELSDAVALRSKIDGQMEEIESMHNRLGEKQQASKGAKERELELQQELTEMGTINKEYSELLQDYAYLQSQFKDLKMAAAALKERNMQLEKFVSRIGELESTLENSVLERDSLKEKISVLEKQIYFTGI